MGTLIPDVQQIIGISCLSVVLCFCVLVAARHMRTILKLLGINVEDWKLPE